MRVLFVISTFYFLLGTTAGDRAQGTEDRGRGQRTRVMTADVTAHRGLGTGSREQGKGTDDKIGQDRTGYDRGQDTIR